MLNFGLNIQTSVLYTVEALSVFYSVSMFVFGGIKAREPVLQVSAFLARLRISTPGRNFVT